ncbi:unnamed protein product [Trichogramma brassicae]|uniref:Ankyrin repeat domain-containing protein 54 n=1 Tax=Trichogramma brassicae TaxID=86971 RepID=A0A6H5IG60_9HYME|nr:unnamed protein product [Trichogramma brassicae]
MSLLKNNLQDHRDERGYTVFHRACADGDLETVELTVKQGVDVNDNRWKCSPLHIAAQYRHTNIVKLLLENGANPNQLDHEGSTPLHALARLNLRPCPSTYGFCEVRDPADEIIDMLVKKGANIEARNRHRDTPLQMAASRFDAELVEALLKRGASLESLDERKMFSQHFKPIELKDYPMTLNIVETMRLLQSAGYEMNMHTRLRMIKRWTRVRENDVVHLIPDGAEWKNECLAYKEMVYRIGIIQRFKFFITPEALDYSLKLVEKLKRIIPTQLAKYAIDKATVDACGSQVSKLDAIMITDDISLYKICQMSYEEGHEILKNVKNFVVPPFDDDEDHEHRPVKYIAKRHIANILIRPQLELLAADLYTTKHCSLNLPYVVCRKVAEKQTNEDVLRLCEQTEEKDLEKNDEKNDESPCSCILCRVEPAWNLFVFFMPMFLLAIYAMYVYPGYARVLSVPCYNDPCDLSHVS